VLLGFSAFTHFRWMQGIAGTFNSSWLDRWGWALFVIGAWVFLTGVTRAAAALTTYEATLRGIRLPLPVVRRGLDYHAAHLLPVAVVTSATVLGYFAFTIIAPSTAPLYGTIYLYVLCGEAVLAAVYLFKTYWIAMRNLMYANR
jgi:hypothetical protein